MIIVVIYYYFLRHYISSLCDSETGSPGFNGSPKESGKRSKRSFNSKTFKIQLSYAATIPAKYIALALKGADADNSAQDALRVLDIILRQQAANRYYVLFYFLIFL